MQMKVTNNCLRCDEGALPSPSAGRHLGKNMPAGPTHPPNPPNPPSSTLEPSVLLDALGGAQKRIGALHSADDRDLLHHREPVSPRDVGQVFLEPPSRARLEAGVVLPQCGLQPVQVELVVTEGSGNGDRVHAGDHSSRQRTRDRGVGGNSKPS